MKRKNTLKIICPENFGCANIDQTRVKQILFNLLSNACKFTENGTIELTVSREHKEKREWVLFCIRDSGIGIAEDKLDSLFDPFTQADVSTTRLYGGTGLGLTISKHFITLMDGDIDIKSTVGKGSIFTVTLPSYNKI